MRQAEKDVVAAAGRFDYSGSVPPRKEQLARLRAGTKAQPFDLLVIGGGATGTGIAVDAASRGLSTALVERDDFAAGTSSRSTKLVHGGVRYLEKAALCLDYSQLKLVYEALAERKSLLENAPYLSNALPIMMPCWSWWEAVYFWAGMKARTPLPACAPGQHDAAHGDGEGRTTGPPTRV